METSYDAIVIGAGPAGSTAAILLARAGWPVALLEAKPFPRRKVCGECIAASNLPLLDALGLGEELRQRAGPELRRVALWYGEESITASLPPRTADGHSPWGFALGREHLDLLLLERARAAGATVLQPCRVLAIHSESNGAHHAVDAANSGGAQLKLRAPVVIRAHGSWQPPPAEVVIQARGSGHGQPPPAPVVIPADGAWELPQAPEIIRARGQSPPRDGTPWSRERRGSDLLGFKASFRNAALDDGLLPVLVFAGGYGGMVVAGDGLATLACCIRRDRLTACRHASVTRESPPGDGGGAGARAGEAIEALLRRECLGVKEALADASRVGPWLAAGPIRPGVRLGGAHGGIYPIGNAAGEVHPIIGEGISMALQSAWLLCEELTGSPDALRPDMRGQMRRRAIRERYTARWRAHFSRRMRLAACFAHMAMRPAVAAPLLPLLRHAPALLSLAAYGSGKTRSVAALSWETPPAVTSIQATEERRFPSA